MFTGCQQPVNITHGYTNCCLYRADPPDDKLQDCSKHLEDYYWNKLVENRISCWLYGHNNSKFVIFQEKLLKVMKCYNFPWVQRRHNCSPAASFANCVMTLYLLKVHLERFFLYQQLKNAKFWVVTTLSQMSDMWTCYQMFQVICTKHCKRFWSHFCVKY